MNIKKGQMITFAQGEYSDYCVNGLVVALKTFNLKEQQQEWESENTSVREFGGVFANQRELKITGKGFLPWLVGKELVEDVDYIEIHTGSYGRSQIEIDLEP